MKKEIITISREYCSGGGTIGKKTAEKLGIPFYDTEIIKETIKRTGLSEKTIQDAEQRVTNSFLFNIAMGVNAGINYIEKIYFAEKDIILEKASEGPCVIVGRSADFILKDNFPAIRAFIYADKKVRIEYAKEQFQMEPAAAKAAIERSDKERALHSKNFHDKAWGERQNYDILLNSGALGLETCSDILVKLYQEQQ